MDFASPRRRFLAVATAGLIAALVLASNVLLPAEEGKPVETLTITEGDLKVIVHDNTQPRDIRDDHYPWSGLRSLVHLKDAPDFNAFSPTGLNFEHIASGHKNP